MMATLKSKSVYQGLFLFILLAVVVALAICWGLWLGKASETVTSSSDAGEAVSATYSVSSFGAYVTRIETSNAVFQVQGTLSITKGERFIIEERKNGDTKLCRLGTKDCRSLTS